MPRLAQPSWQGVTSILKKKAVTKTVTALLTTRLAGGQEGKTLVADHNFLGIGFTFIVGPADFYLVTSLGTDQTESHQRVS